MKFALVLNHDPLLYAGPLHRTLQMAGGRLDCFLTVPGIKSPERKKKYMRAVMKIFGLGYVAKTLWRFLRAPFWSFARLARHHRTPFFRHTSVNSPEFRARLTERGITHVLSVTAEIYKKETLAMPGVAFYNFHGSILPGNKGLLPIFWACVNGQPQGITLHEISEKIDEGAILFQERLEGAKDRSMPAVTDVLIADFPRHVARALDHLERSLPPALLNDGILPSYGPIPTDADVRDYFAKVR